MLLRVVGVLFAAKRIEQQLLAARFRRSVLLITESPSRKALAERVKRANALGADLFLSIHHQFRTRQVSGKMGV